MVSKFGWLVSALLMLAAADAAARAKGADIDKLGSTLTPVGAEAAANADGSIPAWGGGLTQPPACYGGDKARFCDPYAGDKPLYTVTAKNLEPYRDRLCAGQRAMFERYPDTYRLNVYPAHRSAAYPAHVYAGTRRNAEITDLSFEGEVATAATAGVPFPFPQDGADVIWNHRLRWLGTGLTRNIQQATASLSGDYGVTGLVEMTRYAYGRAEDGGKKPGGTLYDWIQIVTEPSRMAGVATLLHEVLGVFKKNQREAWRYEPKEYFTRRYSNLGYDNPSIASDGLLTDDQHDGFSGALDRYNWKLVGKKEMLVPYNAYALHGLGRLDDLVRRGHINQDVARYELHRVWVVDAKLKAANSHAYAKRVFYVDEDSWQILLVDLYDRTGELIRWQEMHPLQAYTGKPLAQLPVVEAAYDLNSGRYLVQTANASGDELVETDFDPDNMESGDLRKLARQAVQQKKGE